jgi:hypothetical protein
MAGDICAGATATAIPTVRSACRDELGKERPGVFRHQRRVRGGTRELHDVAGRFRRLDHLSLQAGDRAGVGSRHPPAAVPLVGGGRSGLWRANPGGCPAAPTCWRMSLNNRCRYEAGRLFQRISDLPPYAEVDQSILIHIIWNPRECGMHFWSWRDMDSRFRGNDDITSEARRRRRYRSISCPASHPLPR